jgi:hypothetical protein
MRYSMHWSMVTAFNQCMCLVKSWHSGTDYYMISSEFTYMKRNCIACNLSTCMYVCICMFMSRTVQCLPTKISFWLNSYNIPTYLFMGRFFFMPDYDMDFTCGMSEWVLSVVPFISQLLFCGVMNTIRTYLLTCLLAYLLACLLAYLRTCVLAYLLTCLLAYLLTCLLACLLTYLLTYLLAYLLAYLFTCLLTYFLCGYLGRGPPVWDRSL